jgi:hypothetical protein
MFLFFVSHTTPAPLIVPFVRPRGLKHQIGPLPPQDVFASENPGTDKTARRLDSTESGLLLSSAPFSSTNTSPFATGGRYIRINSTFFVFSVGAPGTDSAHHGLPDSTTPDSTTPAPAISTTSAKQRAMGARNIHALGVSSLVGQQEAAALQKPPGHLPIPRRPREIACVPAASPRSKHQLSRRHPPLRPESI